MRDTHAMDQNDLTRAAVLWTGRGRRSWPHRDDAALVREFGEARGLDLLLALRSLEADFYTTDAHLTEPDPQTMTDRAATEFRSRHRCYSSDYK